MNKSKLKSFFLGTLLSLPYKLSPRFHFFLFKLIVKLKLVSLLQDPVLNAVINILKKDDIVFDIGANRGTYSYYFKFLIGEGGEVYSFEPQKKIFNQLKHNLRNISKSFNFAISDKNGLHSFYEHIEGSGPSSSLEKHQDLIKDGLTRKVKIETKTLDKFCNELEIIPNFIKIDAEGHDLNIIIGAKEVIKKYKPVLIFEFFPNLQEIVSTNKHISFLQDNYNFFVIEKKISLAEYLSTNKTKINFDFKGQENVNILCTPKNLN